MANPPLNPISFRLPAFDLTTEEGRQQAHRYVASGIVDLNKAIKALKSQLDTTNTTVANNASSASSGPSSSGVISFNTLTGAVTYFPELGMVNDQLGNPSYLTQVSDSGKKIIVGDSVPGVITLNSSVPVPWFAIIDNDSTAPYSLIPSTGTLHGPNVINDSSFGIVFFDGTDFWAGVSGSGGSGGGPAGPPGPTGPTGPAGAPGAPGPFFLIDPDEPAEPVMIPGPPGAAGAAGLAGATGVTVLFEPDYPDDPLVVPGVPGAPGAAGPTGAQGPPGPAIILEPDPPEEPMMIPGPPAPTGAGSGTVTSVGLTMPSDFIVGGSPVTTSGTLAVTRGGVYTGNHARAAITSSGTLSAAFGSNVTAGNAILVLVYNSANVGVPSDGQGDTFTNFGSFPVFPSTPKAYIALNVAGGATTISFTATGGAGFVAFELRNIVGVSAYDASGSNQVSSGTPVSLTTTATTTNVSDYLAAINFIGSGGPYTFSWSSGFTGRYNDSSADALNVWTFFADENVATAGSQSVTFNSLTGGGLTNSYGLLLIGLKVATGVLDVNGQCGHITAMTSLTTVGSSGAATFTPSTGVLNVPSYGSSGGSQYPFVNLTPPNGSGFAWQNQGTSVVTVANNVMVMNATGTGGDQLRFYGVTLPATPWTVIAAFIPANGQWQGGQGDYSEGLALSDGTKYRTWWVAYISGTTQTGSSTPSLNAQGYDNATTFNSGQNIILRNLLSQPIVWQRISDDGTTRTYYISGDPTNQGWTKLGSETHTNYLTPTKAGIVMDLFGSPLNGITINGMVWVSWNVTSP